MYGVKPVNAHILMMKPLKMTFGLSFTLQDKMVAENIIRFCYQTSSFVVMFFRHDTVCNNHLPASTHKLSTQCRCQFDKSCFDSFLIFCRSTLFTKLPSGWKVSRFQVLQVLKQQKHIVNPAHCVTCLKTSQFHHRKKGNISAHWFSSISVS